MKKNIFGCMLILILLMACDNKENITQTEFKVVKSEVTFSAMGGNGSVEMSENISSASVDKTWCTVSVTANIVTVKAIENDSLGSRVALLRITSADQTTVNVALCQSGSVLSLEQGSTLVQQLGFDAEGGTIDDLILKSSLPCKITIEGDWLTCKLVGNKLSLTATPANSPRICSIVFQSGSQSLKIAVNQVSYSSLLGDWVMKYLDASNVEKNLDVVIKQKVAEKSFSMGPLPLSGSITGELELTYNPTDRSLTIANLQYLAKVSNYYVYSVFWNATSSYTISMSVQYKGSLSFDPISNAVQYDFVDNGTWSGNKVNGFMFYAFTEQPPSTGAGSFQRINYVSLIKK